MVRRFERFSFAISAIYRSWHKIAGDEMRKYDLKGPYAVYFTAMIRYPDGVTAVELGELCGRDKADVSRAMAQLEQKGLVEKVLPDKRVYRGLLKLTDDGKLIAEQIIIKAKAAVEYASRGLSEEKRAVFYDALRVICDNLIGLSEVGLP